MKLQQQTEAQTVVYENQVILFCQDGSVFCVVVFFLIIVWDFNASVQAFCLYLKLFSYSDVSMEGLLFMV